VARRATVIIVTLLVYVGVVALFVAFLTSAAGRREGAGLGFGPRVAVVELDGMIIDVRDLLADLRSHRENPAVRAVVIRINSPGGVVAPTQELYRALHRVRDAGKPVVASFGAVAASGGYYAALAADRIYANPGSLTGSIGVIMQLPNMGGLMKRVGVDFEIIKAGEYKDIGAISRSMTAEERRVLQVLLDDVHDQFVGAVAEGRQLDRAEVLGFADGRVFSGTQAHALRMVDALGGLEEAIEAAAELAGLDIPPRIIPPRRRWTVFDLVQSRLGTLPGELLGAPSLPVFKTPLYLMD
jgi:protease IV